MKDRDFILGISPELENYSPLQNTYQPLNSHDIRVRAGGLPKKTGDNLLQRAQDYKRIAQEVTTKEQRETFIMEHGLDPQCEKTQQLVTEIEDLASKARIHRFIPAIAHRKVNKLKKGK